MMGQQTVAQQAPHMNGLDVQAAFDTIDAIKADASLARFQFRARNGWINGGENRSMIRDFYGAGREDDSRTMAFEFTNGEPPVLLGNNEGANPVEFFCMRSPDVSPRRSCSARRRVESRSRSSRPSSKGTSTCGGCSASMTRCRRATSRSASG